MGIVDLYDRMRRYKESIRNSLQFGFVASDPLRLENVRMIPPQNLTIRPRPPIVVSANIDNRLGTRPIVRTQNFSQQTVDKVSYSITEGIKTTVGASITQSIILGVLSLDRTIGTVLEFNTSQTQTIEQSLDQLWEDGSIITVPAGKYYKVEQQIEVREFSGIVDFTCDIVGKFFVTYRQPTCPPPAPCYIDITEEYNSHKLYDHQAIPNAIKLPGGRLRYNGKIRMDGTASLHSDIELKVTNITTQAEKG
ncbi:ETX/MTX2 family pore-forming toxin [Bacillus cereus]|uniref:ETX/MTX2 family pore-forming toxin n=1 Tax=Bacillus cereus TaxID=1396 RepID=UPI001596B6E9|nr:ETX/MTX2 family pore-forming toxin [Bacillus cereus]